MPLTKGKWGGGNKKEARMINKNLKTFLRTVPSRPLGVQVRKLRNRVRRAEERRFNDIDSTGNGVAVSTTMTVALLNGLRLGDTNTQREGRKIFMRYLYLNFQVVASTSDLSNHIRIMVVLDKQPNGAVFTVADFIDNLNIPSFSTFNVSGMPRFKVLYDRNFSLDSTTNMSSAVKKRLWIGKNATYDSGDVGTIADIVTGALYFVLVSDSSASPHPTVYYNNRLTYNP